MILFYAQYYKLNRSINIQEERVLDIVSITLNPEATRKRDKAAYKERLRAEAAAH
jgi:hypothetical protein